MNFSAFGLKPLTIEDRPLIDSILLRQNTMLSAYSFASHYIWRSHFTFHWGIICDQLCIFAKYDDYIYMPVPPISSENLHSNPPFPPFTKEEERKSPFEKGGLRGIFLHLLTEVFNIMDGINHNKAVSRIENIDEAWIQSFTDAGFSIKPGESEFVYLRKDLSGLKGDPYKSKRAMCNFFEKHYRYSYEPFRTEYTVQCLELYNTWKEEKQKKEKDSYYNAIIEDSFLAHREVINNSEALGITGRVVIINDRVEGYIFGFERNKDIFYVLLEVTNPDIKGLAQFIFRQFCREMEGYTYINTLGDSGLENLRRVKLSYRPVKLAPSYIVYMD